MAAIQNFKNFLRHGKQARANPPPPADATTTVSPIHAEQQRFASPPRQQPQQYQQPQHNFTEPATGDFRNPQAIQAAHGDYSVAPVDNRNVAAQAGAAAAQVAGQQQKLHHGAVSNAKKDNVDPAVLERIVAEERESKGKLPRYPGLDRFRLIEKMGDGAFSNVYRAKDLQGEFDEVAVKVVRKFELNNNQVCPVDGPRMTSFPSCVLR